MEKKKIQGMIPQIYIIIIVTLAIVTVVTYYTQSHLSNKSVREQREELCARIADEVEASVREYPACEWLLRYWYENSRFLDVEYDVDFGTGTKTLRKCQTLEERHPELELRYVTEDEIRALPEADQKLYAEIVYSWLTTRINQIKRSYHIDFLFIVVTGSDESEHAYMNQFFLFSGADEGAVRGRRYAQVYPLGMTVSLVGHDSQQEAMRKAVEYARAVEEEGKEALDSERHFASAGSYIDYYSYLGRIDKNAVLVGVTYNLAYLEEDVRVRTRIGTAFGIFYVILMLQLIMLHLIRYVLQPLKRVISSIRDYTITKDSEEITRRLRSNLAGDGARAIRDNEIGQLSEDVITLAQEIDNYVEQIETITADKERIEVELGLASRIQADMVPSVFPPFPDRKEFDLYAFMKPAREVGGDFYDFFLIDEDHLALMIADVSGKGVPAALQMMASMIVIRNLIMTTGDPAKALEGANNELYVNNREEMFLTIWLGVLEISTGKLTAANAGHEYPVLKLPGGDFNIIREKHGFVLGVMEDMKYRNYEFYLKPGSKLFLYTDGVPEATNDKEELFGTSRMIRVLRSCQDGTPKEILEGINRGVWEFTGDALQFDDLTMLCVSYK